MNRAKIMEVIRDKNKKNSRIFRKINVHVYYGRTGCGKTRKATEEAKDNYHIISDDDNILWDAYGGEKTLIIDNFYGNGIKYPYLLKLLDGYQMSLPTRTGHTYAMWDTVIITTSIMPEKWYDVGMPWQLERKITQVTNIETSLLRCLST